MAQYRKKNNYVNVEVPIDLVTIISIFREEALFEPESFAKLMVEFGNDGDWTLETEYLKNLKKMIKADFGNKAAKHLKALIEIMESDEEEEEQSDNK